MATRTTPPRPAGAPVSQPVPAVRRRLLDAAAALLDEGGREAVSTRAVCAAAGIPVPLLYRMFGDKQGLLDEAVAERFAGYLRHHAARRRDRDPVTNLRRGWDAHVRFGTMHPHAYVIAYGEARPEPTPAATAGLDSLRELVHEVALAGRLRVAEARAAHLLHSAACGSTLTLISPPSGRRDVTLAATARDAVLAAVVSDLSAPGHGGRDEVAAAVQLRAALSGLTVLTDSERSLLREWLDKIASAR